MKGKENILLEYDAQNLLYSNFAFKVKQLLEEMIKSERISYNEATCRLKKRNSLAKKIDKKMDKYKCLGDITDIAGVRIITFYSDDVDKVAELVEKEFEVDRDNSIDKRKALEPDRFGYCSVHYVVGMSPERLKLREYQQYDGLKCEIQIRTILQHAWAEIEHDLGYKSEKAIPVDVRRSFSRLAGLLEIGDKEFWEIRKFLSSYTEEIVEKIENEDLNNKDIDTVILKEFAKIDKDINTIDQEIKTILEGNYVVNTNPDPMYEIIILELNLLNVHTFGQFKQMVKENWSTAVEISKIILQKNIENVKMEKYSLSNATSIFYLCYAELLKKYHDYDSIRRYLEDGKIQFDDSFVQELITIQRQLSL